MDSFYSVLPSPLRAFISGCRVGFDAQEMAWLLLRNNGDIDRTLQAAQTIEANWIAALRKHEEALRASKAAKAVASKKPKKPKVSEDALLQRLLA